VRKEGGARHIAHLFPRPFQFISPDGGVVLEEHSAKSFEPSSSSSSSPAPYISISTLLDKGEEVAVGPVTVAARWLHFLSCSQTITCDVFVEHKRASELAIFSIGKQR